MKRVGDYGRSGAHRQALLGGWWRRAARWWMPRFGIDYAALRSKFSALTLCGGVIGMTNKQPPDDVSIGKFDILATYAYAKALLDVMTDDEAKQRGMVAAIMGAQARLGIRKEQHEEFQTQIRTSGLSASALIEVGKGSPIGRPGAAGKDVEGVWPLLMLQRRQD